MGSSWNWRRHFEAERIDAQKTDRYGDFPMAGLPGSGRYAGLDLFLTEELAMQIFGFVIVPDDWRYT